jgi:geranylgeranylglycerol-phosphate geranylgeranyltransferase
MRRLTLHLHPSALPMLTLTRPLNCLSAALAVLVGAHVAGGNIFKVPQALAMLAAAAITGGGNAANDYFDQEIDAINKPGRPLPSGQVEPVAAVMLSAVLYTVGIACSLPAGFYAAALAVILVLLTQLYSWKLKSSFLLGNMLVAFLCAMTVVYGGVVVGRLGPVVPSMLLIFVFILSREILKAAEDYSGDAANGVQSIAVLLGRPVAIRLFVIGAIISAVLVFWPWLLGQENALYLILMLTAVVPVMLMGAVILWFWPEQSYVVLVLRVTKLIFFLWLAAMLVGRAQ